MTPPERATGRGLLRLPRPAGLPPAVPLSFAQQRLWTLEQWAPGLPGSIITTLWLLAKPPRPALLARVLRQLLARHEALRSTLRVGASGEAVQVVHASMAVPLPCADLTALAPSQRQAALHQLAVASGRHRFDLLRGPALRITRVRLASGGTEPSWALLLSIHHLVADSTSLGVLAADLAELCRAAREVRTARLPELAAQYPDFAASQRLRLRGTALEAEIGYWRSCLAGARPLRLPADHPRPPQPAWRCRQEAFCWTPELSGSLLELGRSHSASPYLLLLASLQLLLARASGEHDLVLGSSLSQRHVAETAGMVGLLVHTLTLRTSLAGDPDFATALERTRQAVLAAFSHQEVPHEEWLRREHPEVDPVRAPLARVAFTLRAGPDAGTGDSGEHEPPLLQPVDLPQPASRFDLEIHVWLGEDGSIHGLSFYDPDLFAAATIRHLLGRWTALLRSLLADPAAPLSRLLPATVQDLPP